jgi:outer membrane protein TolC
LKTTTLALALLMCAPLLAAPTGGVSLQEVLERAEKADARLELSELQASASAWAAYQAIARALPTLSVGASATRNAKEISVGDGDNSRIVTPLLQPRADGVGRVTLLRGPDVPRALAAYGRLGAIEAEQAEVRDALRADVAGLYLALAEAQALEEVQERAVHTAEELLRLAEARVRLEDGIALEVDEARAEQLRVVSDLERVRGARREVSAMLALRAGYDDEEPVVAACAPCVPAPGEVMEGSLEALAHRGDLLGLRRRENAADVDVWAGWLAFVPEVALQANARLSEPTLFNPDPIWWNAQLVLSWDLFSGGSRVASAMEASVVKDRAARASRLREREAEVELKQARVALEASRAALSAADARREVASRSLAQAQLRYREGLLSSLGVTEAARRTVEAEAAAVRARFAVESGVLRLRRALGLGPIDDGEETP